MCDPGAKQADDTVRLYYTRLDDRSRRRLLQGAGDAWLRRLAPSRQQRLHRFRQADDRWRSLLGMRLLELAAAARGLKAFTLSDVAYNEGRKPRWRPAANDGRPFDFNISHSERLVVVAVAAGPEIGVDVEKVRPLRSRVADSILSAREARIVARQPAMFFHYWSIREAVVKAADCAGLSRLREVEIEDAGAVTGGGRLSSPLAVRLASRRWYVYQPVIDDDYRLGLACSARLAALPVEAVTFERLVDETKAADGRESDD